MKVKTISRGDSFARERTGDIFKVQHNYDSTLHPFERGREYTRALRATKMERMFAKPFIGALSGHIDGVYSMAKHPTSLTTLYSGSGDGEVRIWSLSNRETVWNTTAHSGFVRGICAIPNTSKFITVGEDKVVKIWDQENQSDKELNAYISRYPFTAVDHHRSDNIFMTSSTQIDVWNHERAEPIQTFKWGAETVTTVKSNQTETNILASCGTDRTIILYDLRTSKPLTKLVMTLRTNAIAWNPMEAFNFVTANEDHNCYQFDMRKMNHALNIHKDHVSAVLDVDFSPTGQEFVSGGYDRTTRIFSTKEGHSREVYHTKRMQKIFCVKFSMDSKFALTGSDDGNIRIWKANASEQLGTSTNREMLARNYNKAVKEKYKNIAEIRRIDKHRRAPKAVEKAKSTKRTMLDSIKRKEDNRRKHSKEGTVPYVPERKKNILRQDK